MPSVLLPRYDKARKGEAVEGSWRRSPMTRETEPSSASHLSSSALRYAKQTHRPRDREDVAATRGSHALILDQRLLPRDMPEPSRPHCGSTFAEP